MTVSNLDLSHVDLHETALKLDSEFEASNQNLDDLYCMLISQNHEKAWSKAFLAYENELKTHRSKFGG